MPVDGARSNTNEVRTDVFPTTNDVKLDVLVVGGGMISDEVVLPTLFQEKRAGRIAEVAVCTRTAATVEKLRAKFPPFKGYPDPAQSPPGAVYDDLYKRAISDLGENGMVIVATPDHLHTPVILEAIKAGRDLIVQKPLCLRTSDAALIRRRAEKSGIYVLTDYHKRHDRAVRAARFRYRRGDLGEMLHGHAWIEEKKLMPLGNFAKWCEQSSSFEYIGVHYADAYFYITGLLPKRLVAFGQKKFLVTQGKDAYDAVQALIEWEDGSVFFIQTSWVCSDKNSSLTNQGLQLHGTMGEYWADHKDRNLQFLTEEHGYEDFNPNFFREYDSFDHPGEVDYVGYGYDSIVQGLNDIRRILSATRGRSREEALWIRRELLDSWKDTRALPDQALVGVAINEAVRMSADSGGRFVVFGDDLMPRLQ